VSIHLLDTNLLIALSWPQHVHHAKAHEWFQLFGRKAWATCPLTQLAFIRISSNPKIIAGAVSPREALEVLQRIIEVPGHHFWPDSLVPASATVFRSVAFAGHRQVTDGYLLALAQHHKGKLATFDRGVAELIPVSAERGQHIALVGA
jgi:toxin-antitoxin system PIN domain toxin